MNAPPAIWIVSVTVWQSETADPGVSVAYLSSSVVLRRRCLAVVVFEANAAGAAGCCVAVAQALQLLIEIVRPRSIDGGPTSVCTVPHSARD